MDDRKTSLDDPEYAAFAWSRYWRIMRWMMLVAILCILVALGVLWWWNGIPSIHMVIATVAGIGLIVMLAAALMGQNGRASCRERVSKYVYVSVVSAQLKKKIHN